MTLTDNPPLAWSISVNHALRTWWWAIAIALAVLLMKAWIVSLLVQGEARSLAAEAAGLPEDRVEIHDGLDVTLTGFSSLSDMTAAVAKVDVLDSSWEVTGLLSEETVQEATTSTRATSAAGNDAVSGDDAASGNDAGDGAAGVGTPMTLSIDAGADGTVRLAGAVPSAEVRDGLVASAAGFGGLVVDELQIDPDATAAGGVLTVSGAATSAERRDQWQAAAEAMAAQAGLQLQADITVEQVDAQLNALFTLEPIEFGTASADIRDESKATLDQAAAVLNANPEAGRLQVVGHTDTDGAADANQRLSQRRAAAVVDYLVSQGGVDPARLEAVGKGESEPKVDPEVTAEDKQRNRRIEWVMLP